MVTLDPDAGTITDQIMTAAQFITTFVNGLDNSRALASELPLSFASQLARPPVDQPGNFDALLDTFGRAAGYAMETAGPRHFAYIPGGGLISSAIAEMLARSVNRFTA